MRARGPNSRHGSGIPTELLQAALKVLPDSRGVRKLRPHAQVSAKNGQVWPGGIREPPLQVDIRPPYQQPDGTRSDRKRQPIFPIPHKLLPSYCLTGGDVDVGSVPSKNATRFVVKLANSVGELEKTA